MRRQVVVMGAGGLAKQLPSVIASLNHEGAQLDLLGFLDSADSPRSPEVELIGTDADLARIEASYVLGVGSPRLREKLDGLAVGLGREAVTLVHPQTTVEFGVGVGEGALIMSGARIQADACVGRQVFVNANAVVGHDCFIGAYSCLSPLSMVAGEVRLERCVSVGAGAVVLPGRTVGAGSVVGAGAVVTADIPPNSVAKGVPAQWRPMSAAARAPAIGG